MGERPQRCGSEASVLVQEVMEEEWTALQSEDRRLPSLWGPEGKAEVGLSLCFIPLRSVSKSVSEANSLIFCCRLKTFGFDIKR